MSKSEQKSQQINLDLGHPQIHEDTNLLAQDGTVNYYSKIFDEVVSNHYLERLLATIAWQHDQAIIFGKTISNF